MPGWAWTGWLKGEEAKNQVFKNLDCLRDCFSVNNARNNSDPSCIASLLEDVISWGSCEWKGSGDVPAWPQPQSWGLNDTCSIDPCYAANNLQAIIRGTCSHATEQLLKDPKCQIAIVEQNPVVRNTLAQVIRYSCSRDSDPFIR